MKKIKIKRVLLEIDMTELPSEPYIYFDEAIQINDGNIIKTDLGLFISAEHLNGKEFSFFNPSELEPSNNKSSDTLGSRLATDDESSIINLYIKKDLGISNEKVGTDIDFEEVKNIVVFDVSDSHKIAIVTQCFLDEDFNGRKTVAPFTDIVSIKHGIAYPFNGDFDDFDEDISEILDLLKK